MKLKLIIICISIFTILIILFCIRPYILRKNTEIDNKIAFQHNFIFDDKYDVNNLPKLKVKYGLKNIIVKKLVESWIGGKEVVNFSDITPMGWDIHNNDITIVKPNKKIKLKFDYQPFPPLLLVKSFDKIDLDGYPHINKINNFTSNYIMTPSEKGVYMYALFCEFGNYKNKYNGRLYYVFYIRVE